MKKTVYIILFLLLSACRSYQIEETIVDDSILNMPIKPKITLKNKTPYFLDDIDSIGDNFSKNYVLNIGNTDHTSYKPLGIFSVLLSAFSLGIIPSVTSNEAYLNGTLLYKNEPIQYYFAEGEKNALMMLIFGYGPQDAYEKAMIESNQTAFFNLMKQIANDTDYIKEETKRIDKEFTVKKEKEKNEAAKRKEKAEKKQQERKEKLIKKYGEEVADIILQKKFYIGMSEEALIESLGKPDDINTSVGSWGVHKQYIYGGYGYTHATYIYVENGKITSYQK